MFNLKQLPIPHTMESGRNFPPRAFKQKTTHKNLPLFLMFHLFNIQPQMLHHYLAFIQNSCMYRFSVILVILIFVFQYE